jgi:DNA-binding NarL/FixJ family response regulator
VIRALLVDDHALIRRGLSDWAQPTASRSSVRSPTTRWRRPAVTELEPDIVLMDLSMTGLDGIDATRAVLAASNEGHHPDVLQREHEVLSLVEVGLPNKSNARRLTISEKRSRRT